MISGLVRIKPFGGTRSFSTKLPLTRISKVSSDSRNQAAFCFIKEGEGKEGNEREGGNLFWTSVWGTPRKSCKTRVLGSGVHSSSKLPALNIIFSVGSTLPHLFFSSFHTISFLASHSFFINHRFPHLLNFTPCFIHFFFTSHRIVSCFWFIFHSSYQ